MAHEKAAIIEKLAPFEKAGAGTVIPFRISEAGNAHLNDASALLSGIRQGSVAARRELRDLMRKTALPYIRFGFRRMDPAAFDRCLNDVFLAAWEAVRSRNILDPERLTAFAETVLRCQLNQFVQASNRNPPNPNQKSSSHLRRRNRGIKPC